MLLSTLSSTPTGIDARSAIYHISAVHLLINARDCSMMIMIANRGSAHRSFTIRFGLDRVIYLMVLLE